MFGGHKMNLLLIGIEIYIFIYTDNGNGISFFDLCSFTSYSTNLFYFIKLENLKNLCLAIHIKKKYLTDVNTF